MDEALSAFNRAIKISREDASPHLEKAKLFFEKKRDEEAINAASQAIELDPQRYESWQFRGMALAAVEKYEQAISDFEKALALEVNDNDLESWIWRCCADSFAELEKLDAAILAYEKAVELDSNNSYAWSHMAQILLELERVDEALQACEKAIEADSSNSDAWEIKSKLLEKLGDLKGVETCLKELEALDAN